MLAYHFTEMPYPFLPEDAEERYGALRITLPNKYFDPKVGHELYNRYLDEHEYAEELGLEIMLNEHHQTATCTDSVIAIPAAALIRRTKRAKILLLGSPLPHRNPLRVAEEVAMLDVISGGRIISGFVRGGRLGDSSRQHEPGPESRAVRGGARSHHQGLDDARGLPLGGEAFPLPLREPLAAAVPAAPSPDLDPGHEP